MTDAEFMIIGLLTEIRDALVPVPVEPSDVCDHPEARRVDLSTFGDRDHWVCADCRYDNKAQHVMS